MKTKILGLLAVGLLTGPVTSSAATLYVQGTFEGGGTVTGSVSSAVGLCPANVPMTSGNMQTSAAGSFPGTNYTQVFAVNCSVAGLPIFIFFGFVDGDPSGSTGYTAYGLRWDIFIPAGSAYPWNVIGTETRTNYDGTGAPTAGFSRRFTGLMSSSPFSSVPEPGTLALLGLGLAGLGMSRRRKSD